MTWRVVNLAFFEPGVSKWPFDPLVGCHLTIFKGRLSMSNNIIIFNMHSIHELSSNQFTKSCQELFFLPGSKRLATTVDRRNPANQLRLVVNPVIYMVFYIPAGAGFLPSTVWIVSGSRHQTPHRFLGASGSIREVALFGMSFLLKILKTFLESAPLRGLYILTDESGPINISKMSMSVMFFFCSHALMHLLPVAPVPCRCLKKTWLSLRVAGVSIHHPNQTGEGGGTLDLNPLPQPIQYWKFPHVAWLKWRDLGMFI